MILPQTLLKQLEPIKGFDQQAFLLAHDTAAPVSVRLHTIKGKDLYGSNEIVPWCSDGRYLAERPVFTLDPLFHAGAYYVQEASSMFLHHVLKHILQDRTGLRVLDLCAAPGGKSTLIASLLSADSLLVCNEVIRTRAAILEENIARWGYMNTWVTGNDPREFSKLTGYFDVIVVDAPCSGSGLWRRDHNALNEWSDANVQLCGERQQRILADVWPSLKEDGILIYATCSYSPQEDEEILAWLKNTYSVETVRVPISAEWGIVQVEADGLCGYRFFPGQLKGEGLFMAALRKKEDARPAKPPKARSLHDKKIAQQAAFLLHDLEALYIPSGHNEYSAIHPAHEQDVLILSQCLYLRRVGLPLGGPSAKEWMPAHDVALAIDGATQLPSIEVDRQQALTYLKREDMGLADIPKGLLMVRYNGLGLGWVKALGNRMNNYLPKHWRIRMELPDQM
jgi:16S rRNA C967 or C1407 C5-methylase (RsmB/RsmF family)/NOL1/NOP2/fmu family ribosome biogenesis protein